MGLERLQAVRMTSKPDAALAYARLGLSVFACHTLEAWPKSPRELVA